MDTTEINIRVSGNIDLKGNLTLPEEPEALVIFSHGSGSSRFSPRNRHVAEVLNRQGIATLLTDLLTEEEDSVYRNRFNIDLLTDRLVMATRYVSLLPGLRGLSIGYFGASTGAASAIRASARLKHLIQAVVSRGGRPDLAGNALSETEAPTLLIVGSLDTEVIALNRQAYAELHCIKEIQIVPGAGHLFEEPGTLDKAAAFAANWFSHYLVLHPKITVAK